MLDNQPRGTICIEDIEMGMTRYIRKVVTDKDIEMFAEVSTIAIQYIWTTHMHKIQFSKDALRTVC